MTSTAKRPLPSFYVDIPPSPFHRNFHTFSSTGLKENTTRMDQPHKRKLSDQPNNSPAAKKPKLSAQTSPPSDQTSIEEFPNGSFYCHQCNKKRDTSVGIQCTLQETKENRAGDVTRRCSVKICKPCLKNRYGKDIDEIRRRNVREAGHVEDESYTFKCPKCEDICNCSRCRKSKGLQPTGNLTFVVRRTGGESVAQALADNVNLTGIMPGKGSQKANFPQPVSNSAKGSDHKTKAASHKFASKARDPTQQTKSKPKSRVKRKSLAVLPLVQWTEVPTALSLSDAQDRIQIREFVLRFACVMHPNLSVTHLDELEEISGRPGVYEEDELPMWVSDTCCKAVLIGLLALFAGDDETGMCIKDCIRDLKAAGNNLTKVWMTLETLRDNLSGVPSTSKNVLTFLDPLPPPASSIVRATRSSNTSGLSIVSTAQLVPVLVSLVESSLRTATVRDEIEEGVKDVKGDLKEVKEGIKKEKERWDVERKEIEAKVPMDNETNNGEIKVRRNEHKKVMKDLEYASTIIQYDFVPRFSGLLGQDSEGRTYFTLTPGQAERLAAADLVRNTLAGKKVKARGRSTRGREKWKEDERTMLRDWSWFVAVWGNRPGDAAPPPKDDDDEEEESDDDVDQKKWWGFSDPAEIRKLAKYTAIKEEVDQDDKDGATNSPARKLVGNLNTFADYLEWRVGRVGR